MMSTSVASQRADRLVRVGLLGTYTMLARRAARGDVRPSGPAGGVAAFRAESFGFSARLPAGWVRQSVESLHVAGRGVVLFQDLEILTPEGARLRVGSVLEPEAPTASAVDELVRVVGGQSGGHIVASEAPEGDDPWRDIAIFGEDRTLALVRIAIAGRRVVCADAWLDSESGDDLVRRFFDDLVLLPSAELTENRPSGTYRRSAD
jgi:hypothetical protein